MRTYTVKAGDSPANIAARDEMAGCPRCAVALVDKNPGKATITFPNGFKTFRDLRIGEVLLLPDEWFDGRHDALSSSYFQALPSADGVSSGHGTVSHGVGALPSETAAIPLWSIGDPCNLTASCADVMVFQMAWNADHPGGPLLNTQGKYDAATASAATTALGTPGPPPCNGSFTGACSGTPGGYTPLPPPASPYSPTLTSAAQAAAAALGADANYCASVSNPGSAVNKAVHAFKLAWNGSQGTTIPVGTSNYEAATATALASVLGTSAPTACGAKPAPPPHHDPNPQPNPNPQPVPDDGLSTGTIVGIGLLAAAVVGGIVYVATNRPEPPRARFTVLPPTRRVYPALPAHRPNESRRRRAR